MSATESKPITTRAELMERLRSSSRQEVVLEEMQRLGFWPAGSGQPSELEQLVQREAELSSALIKLGQELRTIQDPDAALKAMRKERLAKARARREETRQRRARERFERATAWHQRRATDLLYLGQGVSAGLNQVEGDTDKLARAALPVLHNAHELANAMGVTLPELRFLSFERRVSRISHYRRFAMPKKTGGERIISAPMPRVKRLQYWVLDNILAKVPLHPAAHGFIPGRSIVSNAQPHVGKAVVINLDLKNFFPSVGLARVKGVFRELGYSEQLATTLGLLCTETPTEEVSVDGEKFFVASGERALPQGAPSSPALTNILCRRLDARVQGCAEKLGFTYTRYADDLTFSGDAAARKQAGKLLWRVKQIIADEGFTPHPEKQHVMGAGHRQGVTGIVVNQKLSLERDTLRRFRATLFQVEKDGPAGKQWNGNENVLDALEGYAQFVRMVDAEKGAPLLQSVRAAREKWIVQAPSASAQPTRRSSGFRALAAQGREPWTGFWQAAMPAAPQLEKTQQQVKQEKLEQKQAQNAKAIPAQQAVGAGAGPAARSARRQQAQEAPPAEQEEPYKFSDRPWLGILIQLYLAFSLCRLYHTPLPLVFALILAVPAWRNYRAYWLRYFSYMCLAILLGIVLRKLL